MNLATYTGLQAAVGEFLNRDDLNAGGQAAGFIQLAEATIHRRLRRTAIVGTLTFTSGLASVALPADASELRSMSPAIGTASPRGGRALDQVSFETLADLRRELPLTGCPRYFAVLGNTVYVAPAPADQFLSFTISYFETFTPLSGTNPTNPLLIEAPDAYLYGACLEAAPYLEHDERIPVWQTRFDQAIDELNQKRQREEFGASLTKARLPVVF